MSISAIGAPSTLTQQAPRQSNWQNMLGAASSALGMSTGALAQQMQQGQSLATIASSKGVSTSSLVSSISGALAQSGQLSGASASTLQQIATDMVNRTPGGHRHPHHAAASASGAASLLAALSPSTSSSGSSTSGASTGAATYSSTGSAGTSSSTPAGSSFSQLA
jgi:hypothetical protein